MTEFPMRITVGLDETEPKAVVQLDENEIPLAHIKLDAPELETVIVRLADCRAALPDPVPPTLDPGTRLLSILDPAWKVEQAGDAPGILLALRHPGFGWIGNLLPPHEAKALGEWLLRLSGGSPGS